MYDYRQNWTPLSPTSIIKYNVYLHTTFKLWALWKREAVWQNNLQYYTYYLQIDIYWFFHLKLLYWLIEICGVNQACRLTYGY